MLFRSSIGGESRSVFKVYAGEEVFLLKSTTCDSRDQQLRMKLKKEYVDAKKCFKECKYFAEPKFDDECEDKEILKYTYEVLYEYSEKTLASEIGTMDSSEVIRIMKTLLIPMSIMEEKGIFHSNLNPQSIIFKDNRWKIVDFGITVGFADESALKNAVDLAVCKSVYNMDLYCPQRCWLEQITSPARLMCITGVSLYTSY